MADRAGDLTQAQQPRFQAVPGPKPVLGLASLGPAPPFAILTEGVFDYLALTTWGYPACAALGTQGMDKVAAALRGCPRVFLAFDNDGAGREAASESLQGPCWDAAAAVVNLPQGISDVGEVATLPNGKLHLPPTAGKGGAQRPLVNSLSPNLLSTGPPSPAGLRFFTHSPTDPRGLSLPISCRGFSPRPRLPVSEAARTSITHGFTPTRRYVMSNENGNGNGNENGNGNGNENGNHRNGANTNGHQRNSQVNGSVNGHQNGNGNHHVPGQRRLQERATGTTPTPPTPSRPTTSCGTPSPPASPTSWPSPWTPAWSPSARAGATAASATSRAAPSSTRPIAIFGFGGWGHEVVGDVTLRDLDQVEPRRPARSSASPAYSATVKVTVPGAPPRTDVGFQPVSDETAEGHETAFKGAVTDALKRSLRTFGAQFGNALYGDVAGQPAGGAGDSLAPALRKTLLDLGVSQGFDEERVRQAVRGQTGRGPGRPARLGADAPGGAGRPQGAAEAGCGSRSERRRRTVDLRG